MLEYVYPAIFHKNNDNSYTVIFPDLSGCITEGKSLDEAIRMAQSAINQWIEYSKDKNLQIPKPTEINNIKVNSNEFVSLIRTDIKDSYAMKRTVSIPKWMDERVKEAKLSLSHILQYSLKQCLA